MVRRSPSDATPHAAMADAPGLSVGGLSTGGTAGRLMSAAADAFADKGFHATTTRDIASRAGLSPAGVYVHFPSKEDLLFALSREGHAAVRDTLVRTAAEAATAPEALTAVVASFSQWHAEHHEIARVVQYEFRHLTPEHRTEVLGLRKEIDATVQQILRDGVASGDFAVEDVAETTLAVMSLIVDVARWYSPGISRTPAQVAATNAALALRLVAA